jgi:hypothetical protein
MFKKYLKSLKPYEEELIDLTSKYNKLDLVALQYMNDFRYKVYKEDPLGNLTLISFLANPFENGFDRKVMKFTSIFATKFEDGFDKLMEKLKDNDIHVITFSFVLNKDKIKDVYAELESMKNDLFFDDSNMLKYINDIQGNPLTLDNFKSVIVNDYIKEQPCFFINVEKNKLFSYDEIDKNDSDKKYSVIMVIYGIIKKLEKFKIKKLV